MTPEDMFGCGKAHLQCGDNHSKVGYSLMMMIRNNDVDEGVTAFSIWLNSRDKSPSALLISLEKLVPDRLVLLHDHVVQKDVSVEVSGGVPFCMECNSNDCAHVGFAICAEQMHKHSALK
ncbi:hypothetical protein [Nitrososphaera viennensis]|uniref:Uncharacterized protein n=2 Tax=Nitrososphaera viennensis TaxID=1034015 RepID=A0A060HSQ5_9ARCH|nr:hypothetical protein [Nitrososphaera viennensis]AIC16197.1 hypothetical protein NVIE_019390 [Nitrososphaera viennensis EN76]UVS68146.1 hypothetical protein NWT39_09570 [Nitrososphaera viennensis]